jgi:F-type H+-transporting ATPase subunit b
MLIDWFTVGAQVLNFLILVWLMKRFLYKPILDAIDEREKRIARTLADADAKRDEAQGERDKFHQRNAELDLNRATLLAQATDQAEVEHQRLLDEARKAADALTIQRQESMANDARNLNQAISRRTQVEVFAIARKVLDDLASTSLEARMVEVFTDRLRELSAEARHLLTEACRTRSNPAFVRSAFNLPPDVKADIGKVLNETLSTDVRVQFETTPHLISGIELSLNAQKLAWNVSDHLTSLEKEVDELLKGKPTREASLRPQPKDALVSLPTP